VALRFVTRSLVRFCCLIPALPVLLLVAHAQDGSRVGIAPIPAEVRSDYFVVTINGRETPVVRAAASYYLLNFDLEGPATVSIRAADAHYWDRGVEVQPMRYGIRPHRDSATITFRIPGPVKLSISRPGDHFADAEMLFLLGSAPDRSGVTAATASIRYYGPGVYREDIEAQSGDRIYLAPGAVVFGSLNLWQVQNVRVYGRGMIIYDGPQDPGGDQGWMHQRAWHCIVMDRAQNVSIEGITCIVRSRTWQIQMKDSRGIGFYNVNVIGGHPRDANQDGMDWLGGGDTTVRNCFIRASDDVFAMEGNWDGYTDADMRIPGHDVTNVTIEDSVVSNSISNTVRVGWPKKTFRSAHVIIRNLDVIHTGYGGCVVPFAFFEMWDDQGAVESHSDYQISNIRLEDYYSLLQIRQPDSTVRDIRFSNISAMDGPPMVPSVLRGRVSSVTLDGVRVLGQEAAADADIPFDAEEGAAKPTYQPGSMSASFDYVPGMIQPHQPVTFRVTTPAEGWHYQWLFGDGTTAAGIVVRHAFPDAQGTLLDGSGRFRVLLRAWKPSQGDVWVSRSVVVARNSMLAEAAPLSSVPGLLASPLENREGTAWDGWLRIPAEGGYTLTLITSRRATMTIDDLPPVQSPDLRIQVCGFFGDAVQPTRQSLALLAGLHRIHIEIGSGIENALTGPGGAPTLYWEGPETPLQPIPESAFVHGLPAVAP
jgi:hypothetical protein